MQKYNKIFLQVDKNKPFVFVVHDAKKYEKYAQRGCFELKGHKINIVGQATPEMRTVIEIFFGKPKTNNGTAREKLLKNMEIFKRTGKYPKD